MLVTEGKIVGDLEMLALNSPVDWLKIKVNFTKRRKVFA